MVMRRKINIATSFTYFFTNGIANVLNTKTKGNNEISERGIKNSFITEEGNANAGIKYKTAITKNTMR